MSCDGEDNDCDGSVDNGLESVLRSGRQLGVCAGSVRVCDVARVDGLSLCMGRLRAMKGLR